LPAVVCSDCSLAAIQGLNPHTLSHTPSHRKKKKITHTHNRTSKWVKITT
jgi:hypothetical protein